MTLSLITIGVVSVMDTSSFAFKPKKREIDFLEDLKNLLLRKAFFLCVFVSSLMFSLVK